jgi:hypothetical protein
MPHRAGSTSCSATASSASTRVRAARPRPDSAQRRGFDSSDVILNLVPDPAAIRPTTATGCHRDAAALRGQ